MARVSIYVPVDLKARMDRVRDTTNWSEVVRPAILSAVTSHEPRKGATMNAVVERLKASKEKHLLETANYGRERGRLWASEKAEYVELRSVVDLAGVNDKEALGSLMSAIDPQNKLDRFEFADLIGVEERDMSNEYAVAFVECKRRSGSALIRRRARKGIDNSKGKLTAPRHCSDSCDLLSGRPLSTPSVAEGDGRRPAFTEACQTATI
jgi:hypothetical protein